MSVATSSSKDVYRAAVEADLREQTDRVKDEGSSTIFYLPVAQDEEPVRVVLEPDAFNFEVQVDPNTWERTERRTYEDAWSSISYWRVRSARRFLRGFSPWIVLAGIGAANLWVFSPYSWISRAVGIGFALGAFLLWNRGIPLRDPYPGFFGAGFIFSTSFLVRGLFPIDWAIAGPACGLVPLSTWGFLHCGGPETIRYFRIHLSRDPRRTAVM